jgi:hypothetical protein
VKAEFFIRMDTVLRSVHYRGIPLVPSWLWWWDVLRLGLGDGGAEFEPWITNVEESSWKQIDR